MPPVAKQERLLLPVVALSTLLGPAFAAAVLPGSLAASTTALVVGVLAQVAATVPVGRLPGHPHIGFVAVLVVAGVLRLADSPWQRLVQEQAVPWIPVAVAWATVRVAGEARTPWQVRTSAVAAVGYLVAVGVASAPDSAVTAVLGSSVPLLGGLCASLAMRLRQARRDRAAALAYRLRSEERQRVAARVHDTLGHVLTLLVLNANTLDTAADPTVREVGARISRLGNEGLAELRRTLTLLDAPAGDEPPRPTQVSVAESVEESVEESVRELVVAAREAGQSVTLDVSPVLPVLEPATASAFVRTVQEGLTNARRYAPGAAVAIELTSTGDTVRVAVRNEPGGPPAGAGSGRGLAALSKRIDLLGGRCDHADTADRGYALLVELPATNE